jgi:hypothetical protein
VFRVCVHDFRVCTFVGLIVAVVFVADTAVIAAAVVFVQSLWVGANPNKASAIGEAAKRLAQRHFTHAAAATFLARELVAAGVAVNANPRPLHL